MKIIYESLKQRIQEETGIQDIRLFNNQIKNLETGKDTLFLPSILIEFDDITYGHKTKTHQFAEGRLKFYVVTEDYNSSPEEAFDLWEKVNTALNYYTDEVNFYPLERVEEEHDSDFTNVYAYIIEYKLSFIHYLTPKPSSSETEMMVGLEVTRNGTTVNVPVEAKEPAKVIDGDSIIYLDRGDVYTATGGQTVHIPSTVINPNDNTTIELNDGDTYTVPIYDTEFEPVKVTDKGVVTELGEGEEYTVVHTPSRVVNLNDGSEVLLNDGQTFNIPLIQERVESILNYPAGAEDTLTITVDEAVNHTTQTLVNVSTVVYKKNNVTVNLPFSLNVGDTFTSQITRANAASAASVKLKNY